MSENVFSVGLWTSTPVNSNLIFSRGFMDLASQLEFQGINFQKIIKATLQYMKIWIHCDFVSASLLENKQGCSACEKGYFENYSGV